MPKRGSRQQKGINPIHQSERDEPRPPRAQPCAARNRLGPVRPRAPYVTAAAWRLRFALFPVASGARRPEEPIVLLAGRVAYARGYAAVWGEGPGKRPAPWPSPTARFRRSRIPVNDGCGGSGVRVRRSRMPFLPSADARSFRRLGLTPELRSPAFIC